MAIYSVWVKVNLDFTFEVQAASYNDAAFLAQKPERILKEIGDILKSKTKAFNDYTIQPYGVFLEEEGGNN